MFGEEFAGLDVLDGRADVDLFLFVMGEGGGWCGEGHLGNTKGEMLWV